MPTSLGILCVFIWGKFEECKAVAGLLEKYSDTSIAKSYRYSLLAMVALIENGGDTFYKKELEAANQ